MGLFEWRPRPGEEPRTVAACEREIRRLEGERAHLRERYRDLERRFEEGKRRHWFPEYTPDQDKADPGFYLGLRMGDNTQAINELGRRLDYYYEQARAMDRPTAR